MLNEAIAFQLSWIFSYSLFVPFFILACSNSLFWKAVSKTKIKSQKKKTKNKQKPILLHMSWIQPLLLWIHFPTTGALENSSGGMREEGWEKNVLLNVDSEESSIYFTSLLSLSPAPGSVEVCASSLWRHRSCWVCCPFLAGPHCPLQWVNQPTSHPAFQGFPSAILDLSFLLLPLTIWLIGYLPSWILLWMQIINLYVT